MIFKSSPRRSQLVAPKEQYATSPITDSAHVGSAHGRDVIPLTTDEWCVVSGYLALSARESEIARYILENMSEVQIAARLSISPRTVHAHTERIYRRLGVHGRYQLVLRLLSVFFDKCLGRTAPF